MKIKFPSGMDWVKKINRTHLLLAGLFGVLLLLLAIPTKETGKKAEEKMEEKTNVIEDTSTDNYRKQLERQLADILEDMEGVGRVEVMITMKDEGRLVVEKDVTRTEDLTKEEDGQGTKRESSAINSQEETVYAQKDSGGNTPFVTKELTPEIEGVLVVAQGGTQAAVVKNISDAVLALFPVEVHKIKVVKMNE